MKEFLENILKQIVSEPQSIKVTEEGTIFTIDASGVDVGVIIGKEGRNIKALRNLLNLKGVKEGSPRVDLKVNAEPKS
jgi:predicted RNA-binding protein YlqC (UPF0109 family)